MAVVLLQPLVFLLQPPKAAPVVPPAPASRGRLCCRGGLTAPYYSHRWPGLAATAASHAVEPVNPRTPLLAGFHCRVFPGSASSPSQASPSSTTQVLSARRAQHGQGTASIGRGLYMERLTAGSTAAARKCLLITRKIMIPPPDSWDPPDGPLYFMKKTFPPDCWDPPATYSHARKCVREKNDSPP